MSPVVNSDCEQFDFININFTPMYSLNVNIYIEYSLYFNRLYILLETVAQTHAEPEANFYHTCRYYEIDLVLDLP